MVTCACGLLKTCISTHLHCLSSLDAVCVCVRACVRVYVCAYEFVLSELVIANEYMYVCLIIDIGVEGLETGSRERIVTIHFRVQTPCCARKAKFLPSLSPVDCVSCSVTGFHSC